MRWRLALVACMGLAPVFAARAEDKPKPQKVDVPYRVTDANHIMVRVKINGKGPLNFIVDTGAPAVFMSKEAAKKVGIEVKEVKKDGEKVTEWAKFDTFELEGGLKIEKVRGRVEDLIQFEGMNKLGLAGVEVHGVIGYEVLAKFRVEYDLTRDKLAFESLDFNPPALVPLGKGGGGSLQTMGPMVKMAVALLGITPNFEVAPRGFTGIEFEDKNGKVIVKSVLAGSPAAKAGLKAGDIITGLKADNVKTTTEIHKMLAKAAVGTKWRFYIMRGDKEEEIVVELGKGL